MDENPTVDLYRKLCEVAQALPFFEKRGRNEHHHYNYVQAADVVSAVRAELLQRDIIVLPGAHEAQHLQFGGNKHLTTVDLTYTFVDITTGQKIVVPWIGVGVDTGGDKGIYKAFTGGLKYALQTTFLVPTTDDPERDQLTQQESQEQVPVEAHKDDARPAAPRIPADRAVSIFQLAQTAGHATINMEADPGTPPEFSPALRAKLALHEVAKIGSLDVDAAEDVEAWLQAELAEQTASGAVVR